MKRLIPIGFLLALLALFLGCQTDSRTIPVYQGMTIQDVSATPMNHRTWSASTFSTSIEDAIAAHLSIPATPSADYYASPSISLILTVLIDNPESYEILSFTLNNVKYQSYQFRIGSDSEHLLLEIIAEAMPGIETYTIDAIKYVDGEAIKDVLLEGDRTISVATTYPSGISSTALSVESSAIGLTASFSVSDAYQIAATEGASLHLYLYDGTTLTEPSTSPGVGTNTLAFSMLVPNTAYELALVAVFDQLDGEGNQFYMLDTAQTSTQKIMELTISNQGYFAIGYALTFRDSESIGQLVSIQLFDGLTLLSEHLTPQPNGFEGLLSNHAYRIEATYTFDLGDGTGIRTVSESQMVNTNTVATPTVSIRSVQVDYHHVAFSLYESDFLQRGTIIEIALYDDQTLVTMVNVDEVLQFDDLLSNHAYRIDVRYRYDLGDGAGERETTVNSSFRTLIKAIPSLTFTALSIQVDHMVFEFSTTDLNLVEVERSISWTKQGGEPSPIEGNEILWTLTDVMTPFVLEIKLSYDRLDGQGVQNVFLRWHHDQLGLLYDMDAGAMTLTGYVGSIADLVLPSFMGPYPVTTISESAFQGHATLTTILVPSSVTSIGQEAFAGCPMLTKLELPGNLTLIGTNLLTGSLALQTLELSSALPYELRYYFGNVLTNVPASLTLVRFAEGSPSIDSTIARGSLKNASLELAGDWITIPNQAFKDCWGITKLILPESIVTIGESAFEGCVNLIDVVFQEGLVTIGDKAFYNDNQLVSVVFPASLKTVGNYAFYQAGALSSVTFQTGPEQIGDGAFYACGLVSLVIPEGPLTIGTSAFAYNYSLGTVVFGEGLVSIGRNAFYNDVNLQEVLFPSSLREIGDGAFQITNLSFLRLPDGLVTIGHQALNLMAPNAIIFVPSSVTVVGYFAFGFGQTVLVEASYKPIDWHGEWYFGSTILWGAKDLVDMDGFHYALMEDMTAWLLKIDAEVVLGDLVLPETVEGHLLTDFAPLTFAARGDLTGIHFPSGLQAIPDNAFNRLGSLTTVTFAPDAQLKSIGGSAFEYCKIVDLVLPEGLETLGASAFSSCANLHTVVLPDSLKVIPYSAFWSNESLYAVHLGSQVTHIEEQAFAYCRQLVYIRLPETLVSVGYRAFYGNNRLYYLNLPASLQTVGIMGLPNSTSAILYSPMPAKPAGWDLSYFVATIVWSSSTWQSDGIDFVSVEQGIAWVAGYNPFVLQGDVVIPAQTGTYQVKGILSRAFRDDGAITSIVLSSGIEEIHDLAFDLMNALTAFYIPNTVVIVQTNAISNCPVLTSLRVQHVQIPATWNLDWTIIPNVEWNAAPLS